MLTRFIWRQLILFSIVSVITAVVLGWYYLRIPTAAGIGQYTLKADLPASGGLYKTANVTYRGETIGKVTAVEPTRSGPSSASWTPLPPDSTSNAMTSPEPSIPPTDCWRTWVPARTFWIGFSPNSRR